MAEPKNVIERVREQLKLEGKARGHRVPMYVDLPDGTKKRVADGIQHVTMISSEVLDLVALAHANGNSTEIVRALEKGHKFANLPGCPGKGTNYADDIFHLLEMASAKSAKAESAKAA